MNSQDEIRRDRENARRGIMPNIQRRIIMRDEPPVADSFDDSKPMPSIETENKETNNE